MDQKTKASRYEFQIGGLLSERLLSAFPELHARGLGTMTVLAGDLPDQAALHGVLYRIESLGLELLEVRRGSSRLAAPAEADGSTPLTAEAPRDPPERTTTAHPPASEPDWDGQQRR